MPQEGAACLTGCCGSATAAPASPDGTSAAERSTVRRVKHTDAAHPALSAVSH